MNVAQLIEKLKELPQEAMVIVDGYEGGCDEIKNVNLTRIKLNVNTGWVYGAHEIDETGDTEAVYIGND